MARRVPDELDSPWKEALDLFLEPFLALLFPHVHAAVDWSKGYESLDKELQRIAKDAQVGERRADKLFKVWQQDGEEAWLLVHVEIQGDPEPEFPERMYVYGYRIYDRYRRPPVSLAVLCDDRPGWRPDRFGYNILGCNLDLQFLTAKLLDYRGREDELERSANPIAAVVLAQLKTVETRQTPPDRRRWKARLVKGLYDRGLNRDQVRQLFRLIDWMMALPLELEEQFTAEIAHFEEERRMPYVTSIERLAQKRGREQGREEGLLEGLLEGISLDLDLRFGPAGKKVLRQLRAVKDAARLRDLARAVKSAQTLEEIRSLLRTSP